MTPAAITTLHRLLLIALSPPPAEARRLFHGRGKQWPGLEQITVDWLEGIVLVTLFRAPADDLLTTLQDMLRSLCPRVLLQQRYLPDCPAQWLAGDPLEQWQIHENGLTYLLDLGTRQNSGLFLDMRHGRQWLAEHADGKSVLNLFAYTCAFSVAAIAGGAKRVVNLDMARAALSRGRENHRLNRHDLSRVTFLGHDLFKSWGKLGRLGPYDLIVIDPPSFQQGSFILSRDLRKIFRRLPGLLSPQGRVLACCNDPQIDMAFLLAEAAEAAPGLRFVQRLSNPAEFTDSDPEAGLKVLLFATNTIPAC
jgi:23S rRNA (cytosine1962-C5)-methyltransferase